MRTLCGSAETCRPLQVAWDNAVGETRERMEVGVADVGHEALGAPVGALSPASMSPDTDPFEGDARLPEYFGPAWPAVDGFAALLRNEGVLRGLVGPNEPSRLWERHLLNSAAAAALLPERGTFIDLGSGGGLPGVVVAAMRPGARVVLLEPMERRTDWLRDVLGALRLRNAEVLRGRAEEAVGAVVADVVTARAVSSLPNLLQWAAPLLRRRGELFAIKGAKAGDEVSAAAGEARRAGWTGLRVEESGSIAGVEPTRVVRATWSGGTGRVR